MKTDHTEFIARHHKNANPEPMREGRKRSGYGPLLLAVLTLSIYAGIFIFVLSVTTLSEITMMTSIVASAFMLLVIFAAYKFYTLYTAQSSDFDLLREVLEGSRGARLITDSADNTVFYNRRFVRLYGGVGMPSYKSLMGLFADNEEALAHFRLLADQAHRGLTDSIELLSNYDDTERWLMVTAQPVSGYAGYIHWRIDDVTQKHTFESSIRDEREKLIDFTDNAPVGFFSVNEEGRFVFANATFARWLGEDLRTLLDKGVLHTYLETPPENTEAYDLTPDSQPRQVVEVRMKGPGGKTFQASINQVVVHENDGRVRTRTVVHDLTSERAMRQALKASEDRFERFFEEAPLGIILVQRDGVIADSNQAFANMLGIPIDDIEGKHFEALINEEDRDPVISAIDKIEKGQRLGAPLDIALNGAEGNVETQMHARRIKETDNIVLHFIDLREQKALEEQFVQSQKMQAVGQLAGGIAHDFNNLLTAMIGFCDLLLLRHKPGDPSFSDIMQIKQNGNRAANLVRQLLAFSRQQTLRPRVHDMADILTELSHLLRRLIGANIELDFVHGTDLGMVKVDMGQMEQVLINLAVNARDAMDGGGQLTIETENFTNRKMKKLGTEEMPPGHWVLIKVVDTGSGIPAKILDRIFEPFFTTKDVGEGTGLGLATVYGIIRQTDGYLHVESKLKKGTTFYIYLPRANEVDEEEAQEEVSAPDLAQDLTGTERILLVEDEDAVRTFSQRALGNKGYEVMTAEDGVAALEVVEEAENKNFDLLITDVVMPNMDGPTLANKMRELSPKLKIIFMSGYTEDKLKEHMGEGIYFLPKPFTLKQLAAKVKEVMDD